MNLFGESGQDIVRSSCFTHVTHNRRLSDIVVFTAHGNSVLYGNPGLLKERSPQHQKAGKYFLYCVVIQE